MHKTDLNSLKQYIRQYDLQYKSDNELRHDQSNQPLLVFQVKKDYTEPKLYHANSDISKQWYVYYYVRNPFTEKLEGPRKIYFNLNSYKTLRERRIAGQRIIKACSMALKNGLLNPYNRKKDRFAEKPTTIREAFDLVYSIKEKEYVKTFADYKQRMNRFKKWLFENGFEYRLLSSITKQVVIEYLNDVLNSSSARNRNNARVAILGFFQTLKDQEIITENFVRDINVMSTTPLKNKTYNQSQTEQILAHIKQEIPHLYLYIQFISYMLMRPVEINRIKIKDINIADRKIYFDSKTSQFDVKMIPEILLNELPEIKGDPENYLFGVNGLFQAWETTENNRRNHYSKLFKKVKDHFKLGDEYGLYSFRHTFITQLYLALRKQYSPFEAKSRLMSITGHNTMDALNKYLRDINAELPEDYSHLFTK